MDLFRGGMDIRHGHFSVKMYVKMYVKMKELGPWGGGGGGDMLWKILYVELPMVVNWILKGKSRNSIPIEKVMIIMKC